MSKKLTPDFMKYIRETEKRLLPQKAHALPKPLFSATYPATKKRPVRRGKCGQAEQEGKRKEFAAVHGDGRPCSWIYHD